MATNPSEIKVSPPKEKKVKSKADKRYIALTPLRRLMKQEGVILASNDAVVFLRDKLEETASKVIKKTVTIVNAEKENGFKLRISPMR